MIIKETNIGKEFRILSGKLVITVTMTYYENIFWGIYQNNVVGLNVRKENYNENQTNTKANPRDSTRLVSLSRCMQTDVQSSVTY